mgnify:CR=1 FL=1
MRYVLAQTLFLDTDKISQSTSKCVFFGFRRFSPTFGGRSATVTDILRKNVHMRLCRLPIPTENSKLFNHIHYCSSGMEHRNRLNVALHSHFPTSDYFRLKFLENGSTDLEAKHSVYTAIGVLSNGIVRSRSRRLL